MGQGGYFAPGAIPCAERDRRLFFIIPVIDNIPYWIDTRVITTGFKAEKKRSPRTPVPVDVDAVLFWESCRSEKGGPRCSRLPECYQLGVPDCAAATSSARPCFPTCWKGRDKISSLLQKIIDERTEPWGINVISVEVKDVLIPSGFGATPMSMAGSSEKESARPG